MKIMYDYGSDLGEVAAATPTPPSPPTFKEIVERILEELANLPKEHQQKLYRFLHDSCDCRI